MAKKERKLVAHVDVETYERFNAMAERLGDRPSALLRKLATRAIEEDAHVSKKSEAGHRRKH